MIGVDVRDDGDHRLQVEERRIRFVGLDDDEIAVPEPRIAAGGVEPPTDDERRIEAAFGQHARNEAGGGRLAVRSCDRHAALEPHQLREHQCARHHRDAALARGEHFRVVRLHGARHHDGVGAFHLVRLVLQRNLHAERAQAPRCRIGREIRAAHLIAKVRQHFGDAGHADAADAHEMDAPHLVLHRALISLIPCSAGLRPWRLPACPNRAHGAPSAAMPCGRASG